MQIQNTRFDQIAKQIATDPVYKDIHSGMAMWLATVLRLTSHKRHRPPKPLCREVQPPTREPRPARATTRRRRPAMARSHRTLIVIARLLTSRTITVTRARHSLLAQCRRAVAQHACFFRGPLGADLLPPHAVVAAFFGEELVVRAAFGDGARVQDEDLICLGDC
jgi:hypothetical protein